METIWAPWRIKYIEKPKEEGCIFCDKPSEKNDKSNFILHRGKHCFIIMNIFPYNNAHLMVVPYKHTSELAELSAKEKLELMDQLVLCKQVLTRSVSPHGFNIGMNMGLIAGAGIDDHLHFHIVPRWKGDTNFMPVLASTKVVSEGLEQTWEKLKKGFEKKNI